VPAPAAIANAVSDATGARITELPITPERIAMALVAGRTGAAPGGADR
jgi:CO/xanthine dehydrogenase Mo-binding subunit